MQGGDDAVDFGALRALAEWHLECGTDALSPVGTTGESPTLTISENQKVIAEAVRVVAGRRPVVAGVGANSTAEALELTRQAKADGADFGLSVVPYYNRPPQEGMFRHFSAIADAVELPLILYDVPKRCGAGLENETVARLARHPNIAGLKDATGDPAARARLAGNVRAGLRAVERGRLHLAGLSLVRRRRRGFRDGEHRAEGVFANGRGGAPGG